MLEEIEIFLKVLSFRLLNHNTLELLHFIQKLSDLGSARTSSNIQSLQHFLMVGTRPQCRLPDDGYQATV